MRVMNISVGCLTDILTESLELERASISVPCVITNKIDRAVLSTLCLENLLGGIRFPVVRKLNQHVVIELILDCFERSVTAEKTLSLVKIDGYLYTSGVNHSLCINAVTLIRVQSFSDCVKCVVFRRTDDGYTGDDFTGRKSINSVTRLLKLAMLS